MTAPVDRASRGEIACDWFDLSPLGMSAIVGALITCRLHARFGRYGREVTKPIRDVAGLPAWS